MDKLNWMDGKWIEGDPLIMKSWDQAIWLGAAIFDGARAFDGYAPDLTLHCERAIRSAANLGLKSPKSAAEIEAILREGIAQVPARHARSICAPSCGRRRAAWCPIRRARAW